MIELKNVNKYFNKGKKNEIHAIDNTSLTLPDSGLVALLGESGCGKTTMLNAIGGLDTIKSGSIFINGQKISSKNSDTVDKIRNLNVGYIFQDYKLIDDLSVYDNVAMSLQMIGIKDKEELDARINYVLNKVGIYRYRSRPAGTLSGGERQRVGIARALVKNPNIILADEPTGNLDSKNSVEIMKIIKKISKDRLVILVTHERPLAEFYADRIIELVDGKVVSDNENTRSDTLDYEIDNVFYLKEFKKHEKYSNNSGNRSINYYGEGSESVNIDIVFKNGNIYIQSKEGMKVEVVDDNSAFEMVDDYKQSIIDDTDTYDFDMNTVGNQNIKKKYSSIFSLIKTTLDGFNKAANYKGVKKLILVGFFFVGMFVLFAVGRIALVQTSDPSDIRTTADNYICVEQKDLAKEDFEKLLSVDGVSFGLPGEIPSTLLIYRLGSTYQAYDVVGTFRGSIQATDILSENDVAYGRLPKDKNEIAVDIGMFDYLLSDATIHNANVQTYEEFLDRDCFTTNANVTYKVVGIVDTGNPSIYFDKSEVYKAFYYGFDYLSYQDGEEAGDKDIYTADKIDQRSTDEVLTDAQIIEAYFEDSFNNTYFFAVKDKINAIASFAELGFSAYDVDEKQLTEQAEFNKESNQNTIFFCAAILLISFVEMYIILRASFLSRIKEVGTLRAIGVKKLDIYKVFIGEILAISIMTTIPAMLIMYYLETNVLQSIRLVGTIFHMDLPLLIVSIVGLLLFNIISGIIPVWGTMNESPAEILSRCDVE